MRPGNADAAGPDLPDVEPGAVGEGAEDHFGCRLSPHAGRSERSVSVVFVRHTISWRGRPPPDKGTTSVPGTQRQGWGTSSPLCSLCVPALRRWSTDTIRLTCSPRGLDMVIEVRWGSATHQGRVRDHNEDALLAGPDVFAVADGMGGYAGGAVASAIAVARLADLRDLHEVEEPDGVLSAALCRANAEIRRRASADRPWSRGWARRWPASPGSPGPGCSCSTWGTAACTGCAGGSCASSARTTPSWASSSGPASSPRRRPGGTRTATSSPGRWASMTSSNPWSGRSTSGSATASWWPPTGCSTRCRSPRSSDVLSTPGTVERRARALLDAALQRGGRDNISVVVVAVAGTDSGDGLEADTSPSVTGVGVDRPAGSAGAR